MLIDTDDDEKAIVTSAYLAIYKDKVKKLKKIIKEI
jgi:hypothetical protein